MPPPWDQSDYIFMGIYEYEALANANIFQFAKIVMSQAPTHAPLFPVSTIPFYFFFGLNPYSAYLANSVYLFILLFSVFFIAERLGGKKTAIVSIYSSRSEKKDDTLIMNLYTKGGLKILYPIYYRL